MGRRASQSHIVNPVKFISGRALNAFALSSFNCFDLHKKVKAWEGTAYNKKGAGGRYPAPLRMNIYE